MPKLTSELLKSESTPVTQRVKEKCQSTETGEEELSQRILYSLRPTGEHVPYPLVVVPEDQVQRPLLTIQPAYQLVLRYVNFWIVCDCGNDVFSGAG